MFGVTAGITIVLAVVLGPAAVTQATGILAAATAVAGLILELQRHGPATGPIAPANGQAGPAPGRRWRRRLPWLVLAGALAAATVAATVLLITQAPATTAILGRPESDGYCQATGQGGVRLTTRNAYGWQCTASSVGDDATDVCAWTFHTSHVVSRVANFDDPSSWQCWRVAHKLGALDFNVYCSKTGHASAVYVDGRAAYGWYCAGSGSGIDTQEACAAQYDKRSAVSRFRNFYDKDSWECWA